MAEQAAKVTVTGTAKNPVFNIDIPTGAKGERGFKGDKGDIGATPTVTIGEVTTTPNPADDVWMSDIIKNSPLVSSTLRSVFPTTMQGAKGDPGVGFTTTTLFASTKSFDDLKSPGHYQWNQLSLANGPTSAAPYGTIEVIASSTTPLRLTQTFYPQTTGAQSKAFYQRTYVDGAGFGWYPWVTYSSQRVDSSNGRTIYTWDETNNREQLIYGDTGMRSVDIPTEVPVASGSKLHIRRNMNTVTLTIFRLTITGGNGAGTPFLEIPVGFRAVNGNYGSIQVPGMIGDNMTAPVQISNHQFRSWWTVTSGIFSATITYQTSDPWPTTLPGTAIGTIPNL